MTNISKTEVSDVISSYPGLSEVIVDGNFALKGALNFEASFGKLEKINACFDVVIIIPSGYPQNLPTVYPDGFKFDHRFEHVNPNGSCCLEVPIEERRIFNQSATLLGFINTLVVPFLYSYCYFIKHGQFPFGDRGHGEEGVLQYYKELFGSKNYRYTISALRDLYLSGYKPHEKCPCGSGKKLLRCHKKEAKYLLSDTYKPLFMRELLLFFQE
jgi:hypothetical protein